MPARSAAAPLRIAIDTGGTFTDCVWLDPATGALQALKVFSTPADPSKAIAEAVTRIAGKQPVTLLHGTTVGTNALLQRKGGRVAFVTTRGFEDSIEIGRQSRPKLYDLFFDAIEPLVSRPMRFGVAERTDKDGTPLMRPSAAELRRLSSAIGKARPDAIAISLLFSFADSANERAVAAALRRLRLPLSISHEILPEFREYERASTVVINAYLQPVMSEYLTQIPSKLRRLAGIFVMQSNGGLTTLATAVREPVRTVLSGPAGGVVGAAAFAQRSGFSRIIGFDMGGTSTDVCLVDGKPSITSEAEVAGLPVRVPMLNIHTVGAGGGSIARFDPGGALRVGPESAGADPGPICYGRGSQPTVTDANVILGRLPVQGFLGGGFELDAERTRRMTAAWLRKQRSNLSLERFAEGVIRIVDANMEKVIRVVSIEKGFDTREYSLVAFGGAGAMHACALAEALDMPRVIVPALPGALSAVGILMSDVVKDYSRTVLLDVAGSAPFARAEVEFRTMRRRAHQDFKRERWKGSVQFEERLEMRYRGQGYELPVPYSKRVLEEFHEIYRQRYGYCDPQHPVEIVTVRLRAWIRNQPIKTSLKSSSTRPGKPFSECAVVFGGRTIPAQLVCRDDLTAGRRYGGPAIVTEYSATTLVPPGWEFSADKAGNLLLEKKKRAT